MEFNRFGPAHLSVLVVIVSAALTLLALVWRHGAGTFVRFTLVFLLGAGMMLYYLSEGMRGTLDLLDFLPFHLSDFAVLLAIFALLTVRQRAAELLYFLSIAELLALLTPDVARGFDHPHTISFFLLHGGTMVAAIVLTFGFRLQPEKGAVARALIFLNAYAAFAAVINGILGTNFLYLRRKPIQPSPLDWMGPWPWYLLAAELIAVILFSIAYLPFRGEDARS